MNKTNFKICVFLLMCICSLGAWAQKDHVSWVDPFIGSGGHGHVFVGASVPFGAVQLGPNNVFKDGTGAQDTIIVIMLLWASRTIILVVLVAMIWVT